MFDPWVRKIPWSRKMATHSSILPWKNPWQKSLEGYSPWGCKEWDMTDWLTVHFRPQLIVPRLINSTEEIWLSTDMQRSANSPEDGPEVSSEKRSNRFLWCSLYPATPAIQTLTAPEKVGWRWWEGAGDLHKRIGVVTSGPLLSVPAPARDAPGTPGLPCWGPAAPGPSWHSTMGGWEVRREQGRHDNEIPML